MDRGWYISLSGSVTYTKKARMSEMEELIRYIPQDRLLLETDAPYLAPVPHRGERNESAFVGLVLKQLAVCYGVGEDEMARQTNANVRRVFGFD